MHDAVLATLAHLSLLAGLINFAFATNRNLLYVNAALWILAPNQTPAIRAILSKIVNPDEVGKVHTISCGMEFDVNVQGVLKTHQRKHAPWFPKTKKWGGTSWG